MRTVRFSTIVAFSLMVAAGCSDDDSSTDSDKPCVGDQCPGSPGSPTFGGVRSVANASTGGGPPSVRAVRVTWIAASDDKTTKEQIKYRIYASTRSGAAATKKPPVLTTEAGATSAFVNVDPGESPHFIVVRAVDADGKEDGNTVEKITTPGIDTAAPDFGGIKQWRPEAGAGVTLVFEPPRDDMTAPEGMRYVLIDETGNWLHVVDAPVDKPNELTFFDLGPAGSKKRVALVVLDAAGRASLNPQIVEVTLGQDSVAPTFGGCTAAEVLGSKIVRVTWAPATDDVTAKEDITYEIFAANAPGAHNFAAPTASVKGVESVIIRELAPATTHHFVCRARDASGNTDLNAIPKAATTRDNITPPVFLGATGVFDPVAREVSFTWAPATDDKTTAANIVYAIYESRSAQASFDFTSPRLVTSPGATSAKLSNLPSRTSFRFIVRARDEDYNEDQNALETAGSTPTSFSLDVIPMFAQNCAVVGCHVAPASMGGMSLSAFNAYDSIVDVNAAQRPALKRVMPFDSANSYLYQKVTGKMGIAGNPMPAPGTGNVLSTDDKELLKTWIDQGALRN